MITHDDIAKIIQSRIEPCEPVDTIMRVLRENDGKRFDKRFIDRLNLALSTTVAAVADPEGIKVRDRREYGMTSLYFHGTSSLLISYQTKNVVINAQWIYNNNPAFFAARDERNAHRQELLKSPIDFIPLATAANIYATALSRLQEEFNKIEFGSDQYDISTLVGLSDD